MAAYEFEGPTWPEPIVTWSFATANYSYQAAYPFSATMEGSGVWQELVRAAFAEWSIVSGFDFVQVADGAGSDIPDIRIGFGRFGHDSGTIGEAAYSWSGDTLNPGIIVRVEDPGQWATYYDASGDLAYVDTSTTAYGVLLHEIGHALGLAHSSDPHANMYPIAYWANEHLNASDIAGIRDLYGIPGPNPASGLLFAITDGASMQSHVEVATPYSGPVDYLQYQHLGTAGGEAIAGTRGNDFINALAGDDAISAGIGSDVLDGGTGSNFLSGGPGHDVFFLDGRGGQVSWATITDWEWGEELSLWGWQPGVSVMSVEGWAGAPGYQGATLHTDLDGNGSIDASVTWAGQTAIPESFAFPGLLWLH